jgi:hypothetical protein
MKADRRTSHGEEGYGDGSASEPATMRLVTTGRTSGLPHTVVVRFVFSGGAYFVVGGDGRSDWFVNALASRAAKVRISDYVQTVACEQFFDTDLVRGLFARKYGPGIVKEWYSSSKIRSLMLTPTALPHHERGSGTNFSAGTN